MASYPTQSSLSDNHCTSGKMPAFIHRKNVVDTNEYIITRIALWDGGFPEKNLNFP